MQEAPSGKPRARFEEYLRDPDIGDSLLRRGDRGVVVENLRIALRNLGFETGSGKLFDAALEAAVLGFQKEHKHNVVDGQVGPGTRRRLVAALLEARGPAAFERMERTAPSRGAKVFLCYAREDGEQVDKIDQWLQDNGVRVWRDTRDFRPGGRLKQLIRGVMQEADKVVVVYSCRASGRPWPSFEIQEAWKMEEDGRELLIYVLLDDSELPVADRDRIAIRAQGKTLKQVGEALLHGIYGNRAPGGPVVYDEEEILGNPETSS